MKSAPASNRLTLAESARLGAERLLAPPSPEWLAGVREGQPLLLLLAAGKGSRFGRDPKCIQPLRGIPLARHSILAFHRFAPDARVMAIVGYRHQEVASALGSEVLPIVSANQTGGTAWAAYEAFCLAELEQRDPILIISMGDRVVPAAIFERLWKRHRGEAKGDLGYSMEVPRCGEREPLHGGAGTTEADLTLLTAQYEPPRHLGKGRILRDEARQVQRIIEERDIAGEHDPLTRQALSNLTEGNCPLYAIRASKLKQLLGSLRNNNAQAQFYLTDIVAAISATGGKIRTITVTPADPQYDLLCADVTRPDDLALLEGVMAGGRGALASGVDEVVAAVEALAEGRPRAQLAAITRQLEELRAGVAREKLPFRDDLPCAIGLSGGRLRIAFMHPDMARFHGPAWQMPIGAGHPDGSEQIVTLTQQSGDGRLHLLPLDAKYREYINELPGDDAFMFPGEEVRDLHDYERFGTGMSERLLLALGYFSDNELHERRRRDLPLPPTTLWVSNSMRRPFALVGNAIASLRTLRGGRLGERVAAALGRGCFKGLRLVCTGGIPMGGFSSSSALTVATKNSINALYELGIPAENLIHLACQAEYGTGVRAGALDQATEQKGRAGQGTLLSSNPRDHYCALGTYPLPREGRFRIIFPYSVARDSEAWRWSGGAYGSSSNDECLTAAEWRKLSGKAAEIAAWLVRLPLETSFFKEIEEELLRYGEPRKTARARIAAVLRQLPLIIARDALEARLQGEIEWQSAQLMHEEKLSAPQATKRAEGILRGLFEGWREPLIRRYDSVRGCVVEQRGIPLRSLMAYLYCEMVRNFRLINHPDEWIACVSASQCGDRDFVIAPQRLPPRAAMESDLEWERTVTGSARLERWLAACGARPSDCFAALDDAALADPEALDLFNLSGANFRRGLALIDLVEAMLKRAFGSDAVAVRVNAAGQGDYFQLHIDSTLADPEEVKQFMRVAFYRRFGLTPEPEFIEIHAGGGALGVRLSRYDMLERLLRECRKYLEKSDAGTT